MPLLKCRDCMHEWEGKINSICDWCGGNSRVLAHETHMEKWAKNFIEKQEDFPPKYAKLINKHFEEV